MHYIVLDMEWNQPGFADTALCRNGVCMKNEIIQIGAVKLDADCKREDVFECIIKPVSFTSMNKVIKQLTGITDEMIDKGESFESAITRFRDFCGDDFVLLIWGFDDVRIIRNNLRFHGLDESWLPNGYNLQTIFAHQENLENRQYSLQFALEHYDIQIEDRLHDALNDAEYTAMVCEKLDLKRGLEYIKHAPHNETKNTKNANVLIKRKFRYIRNKEDIWNNGFIVRPVCPFCGEKMKFEKAKRIGLWKINIEGHCEKDGDFLTVLKISETPDKTFTVNQQIYVLDEHLRQNLEAKKKRVRHRKRPSKNNIAQKLPTKESAEN